MILIRELAHGGVERQLVALARGLAARGVAVTVAVFYRRPELPPERELAAAGIEVVGLGKRGPHDTIGFATRLWAMLARTRPDVVYGFLPLGNLAALLARAAAPGAVVAWGVRCSRFAPTYGSRLERTLNTIEDRLGALADVVVSNSQRAADERTHRDNLVVIPNGIDAERFQRRPDAAARVRHDFGVAADTPLVGAVGRLVGAKDYVTFLRAIACVPAASDARFVWVGAAEPAMRADFERLAAELGAGRVQWHPEREDVAAVYSALDVLTLPSAFGEGFPNVVGEALACGTACVATDTGDTAAVVGDVGVIVPPRAPERLAQAWVEVLESDAQRSPERRAQRRARVIERFGVDVMVDETRRVLEASVARKRRAPAASEPALFVTGANARFAPIAAIQRAHLERLGYRSLCFDLGGLGSGRALTVDDATFQASGHYHVRDGWTTRALHKPELVRQALAEIDDGEVLVYLDADAVCLARVDALARPGFDVGVTVRWRWDRAVSEAEERHMGRFNAGVIVFRKSRATERFVAAWRDATARLGNDQRALNALLNPRGREIRVGEDYTAAGVWVHAFDGMRYNNPERYLVRPPKIVHYKAQSWERHLAAQGALQTPPTRLDERAIELAGSVRWAVLTGVARLRHALSRARHRGGARATSP